MVTEERRVFFAIQLDAGAVGQVRDALRDPLPAELSDRLRWLPPEDWHVTLRFVGNVPDSLVPALRGLAAEAAARHAPFEISFDELRLFPSDRRPLVLAATGRSDPAGVALAAALERVCQGFGLAPERRPWRPHISLARVRGQRKAQLEPRPLSLPLRARELVLMESVTAAEGRRYLPLERHAFSASSVDVTPAPSAPER